MRKYKNIVIIGCIGKPIPITNEDGQKLEMRLEHILRIIFQNIKPSDQNDTTLGKSLMLSLDKDKDKDIIEIEDTVSEWLVRQAGKIIYLLPIPIYPNGDIIMKLITDGYIKEEKKK